MKYYEIQIDGYLYTIYPSNKKAFKHLKKIKKPYLRQLNKISFSVQSMFMHKIYKHLKDFKN